MGGKGLLVVISAPSGGGKTTILHKVLLEGNGNFRYSVSATTRQQRPGERDGFDYHFLSMTDFIKQRESGQFVEWAEVHGNYYGTLKGPIRMWIEEGRIVLCDLDVDGGLAVKREFREACLLIFIKPPSFESLVKRLKARSTESDSEISKRLERYPKEMALASEYDYCVTNEDLDKTVHEVKEIIERTHLSL